jgi:tRNA (mo5U34)-methyltransferase
MRYHHSFPELGIEGRVTKDAMNRKMEYIKLPEDLTGKTVLDIGAWDGYYSFECEKRGATVTALEKEVRHGTLVSLKETFNSDIEILYMDAYDIPSLNRQWDLVLCMGVIYHVQDPFKLINIVYDCTKENCIIESALRNVPGEPLMFFYKIPNDEYPTSWWLPNAGAVTGMMEVAGFKTAFDVDRPGEEKTRGVFWGEK